MSSMKASDTERRKAYTRKEAAEIWGVSAGLVQKLDKLGRINTIHIGRRKLVSSTEIDRVLDEGVNTGV